LLRIDKVSSAYTCVGLSVDLLAYICRGIFGEYDDSIFQVEGREVRAAGEELGTNTSTVRCTGWPTMIRLAGTSLARITGVCAGEATIATAISTEKTKDFTVLSPVQLGLQIADEENLPV
jgi:hypothetical protein